MENEYIGYFRLPDVLKIIPVSKSTFWSKLKTREYPLNPVKLSPRTTGFLKSEVYALAESLAGKQNEQ